MYPFAYHRPASLAEAVVLWENAAEARYLAGGQTLVPTLKMRLAQVTDLVDLARVPGLQGITGGEGRIRIGAMTRHADVAASVVVRRAIPALAALAGAIGDPAIRNQGTLGGSLANNDPAADYPAAVLGLGADIETDRRVMAADAFFVGLFETALAPGEVITAISIPLPRRAGYARCPGLASRYPLAATFVAETAAGVRVAVTGAAADGVFRHHAFETALTASFVPAALVGIETAADAMNADLQATPAYRAHLVGVTARRAVAAAVGGVVPPPPATSPERDAR